MKNKFSWLVVRKKYALCLAAILISVSVCFPALARVRVIHRQKSVKNEFSPSTKEFLTVSKAFKGTFKQYRPSLIEGLSTKEEVLPSISEFKSSSAELIESKYKTITHHRHHSYVDNHPKSYLHLSDLNLSESFSQSGAFSPSAEFKVSQKKSRRIR